jgi:hypothetical protein
MSLESYGGMILTGETRRTRRKTCPSATLSTTNPTWIDPGANPDLRSERPATNDLSHCTASPAYYINKEMLFQRNNESDHFDEKLDLLNHLDKKSQNLEKYAFL